MRITLGVSLIALAVTGCVTQIQRVPSTWDHATDPDCTTHYGWVAGDAALAAIAAGVGVGVGVGEKVSSRSESQAAAVAGGIVGLGFVVAAGLGAEWVDDCRSAKESLRAAHATTR